MLFMSFRQTRVEEEGQTDVFVSHVEEDSRTVKQMADCLEAAGFITWY